ncbi:hypothetical protein, partial [Escherichia coli]|uniref:hypothetical protein n=1 Tax=Escherichia coli TaxID=562 RepID=UPI002022D72B
MSRRHRLPGTLRRPFFVSTRGVLLKESGQQLVHRWLFGAHRRRCHKKSLDGHGEELFDGFGALGVDQRVLAGIDTRTEALPLGIDDVDPVLAF